MYKLFVLIALSLVSASAFAEVGVAEVPEPQTLALLAAGVAAALIAKRKK